MPVSRRLSGLLILFLVAGLMASACSAERRSATTRAFHILATSAVSPTPTLAATRGVVIYMPAIIQGIPLKATATATPGPQAVSTPVVTEAVSVSSAISIQNTGPEGISLEVEGEVRNDGTSPARSVRVIVEAKSGERFCGRGVLTLLGKTEAVLNPGESWPFSGTTHLNCQAEELAFKAIAIETDMVQVRLSVEQTAVQVSESGDWMLSAVLRNASDRAVLYPRMLLTLRTADGFYLASRVVYASSARLTPGESVPVTITVPRERAQGWASYLVLGTGEWE